MARLQELLTQKAAETNAPFWIIEKGYALSYLIVGVAETPPLDENWVLKGGTAPRKVYFNNYRFSEDLDYFTQSPLHAEVGADSVWEKGTGQSLFGVKYLKNRDGGGF